MKTFLLFSGLFVLLPFAFAQKEANNWVFGYNAAVSWNTGTPVAAYGATMNQNEGVASISDTSGQLLFYTDGVTIRNRSHQVMLNGTGLYGNFSSTQSALIVPQPGSDQLYYVFTTDADGGSNGLSYSVVDMNLDGGKGAVTNKNIVLYTPTCEKLTATRHANGRDVWVISHRWNSSSFYSYLVTPSGVQSNPVVVNVAGVHSYSLGSANHAYGYMKASPDGKKLAAAVWGLGGWLDILDYNNQTGVPSQPITDRSFVEHGPYGVEFSPDSRLLYVSEMNYMDSSRLYQYDLQAGNATAVLASRALISGGLTYDNCGLQLAADGKIYISSFPQRWLHIIQQPDVVGNGCGYQGKGLTWSNTSYGQLGLPNFITSYFRANQKLQISVNADKVPCDSSCAGIAHVTVASGVAPYQYTWQPGNYSGERATGLCAGDYSVTVTDATGRSATATISVVQAVPAPVEIFTDNESICASDTALICTSPGFSSYMWNTGESTPCILSRNAGNYQVTATDRYGCSAVSEHLNLTVIPPPVISISVNGNKIYTMMPSNYQWYINGVIINGANSSELVANEPGYYWLEVRDTNGCVATSTPVYYTSTGDMEEATTFNIYPNPSLSSGCRLAVNGRFVGGLLRVFDSAGRLVREILIQNQTSDVQLAVSPGVYFLRVETDEGSMTRRFVRL